MQGVAGGSRIEWVVPCVAEVLPCVAGVVPCVAGVLPCVAGVVLCVAGVVPCAAGVTAVGCRGDCCRLTAECGADDDAQL